MSKKERRIRPKYKEFQKYRPKLIREERIAYLKSIIKKAENLEKDQLCHDYLNSEEYREILKEKGNASCRYDESVGDFLNRLRKRKIKKQFEKRAEYKAAKQAKNLYPFGKYEEINHFDAEKNKKRLKKAVDYGELTAWEKWKCGFRGKINVLGWYRILGLIIILSISYMILGGIIALICFLANLNTKTIIFMCSLAFVCVPLFIVLLTRHDVKKSSKKETFYNLFEYYKMVKHEKWFLDEFGTEWLKNNPIPNEHNFHDSIYEWEKRRRREDKEYFDCITNTEWAVKNPDISEYSYLKSLKFKYNEVLSKGSRKKRRKKCEKHGIYMDNYSKSHLSKHGYFKVEYGCGDIYGHFLWLKRRFAEDREFCIMCSGLKKSPFAEFAEFSDWTRSRSLVELKDTSAKELTERQQWINFVKQYKCGDLQFIYPYYR